MRESHAGRCAAGRRRHEWGKERRRGTGHGLHALYEEPCLHCPRLRIREYTMRGNHIAGYENDQQAAATQPVPLTPDTPIYWDVGLPSETVERFGDLMSQDRHTIEWNADAGRWEGGYPF